MQLQLIPSQPDNHAKIFIITDAPLAGVYTVGIGQVSPNFTSLTSAISNLNLRGVSAPVEFQLTDATYTSATETYPLVINQVVGGSPSNRISIRPTLANTVISGNAPAIFRLNGADYVTIDGSITPGQNTRDLTIVDSSSTSTVINIASSGDGLGCINDSILNCKLIGPGPGNTTSTVLHIGGAGFDVAGADNTDIVVFNNEIIRAYKGITSFGTSSNKTKRLAIIRNVVGTSATTSRIAWRGIDVNQADTVTIDQDTVQYVISSNINIKAFNIGAGVTNAMVTRNVVDTSTFTGTSGYGVIGIHVETGVASNTTIANNVISRITADGWNPISSTDALVGIRLATGSNYNVYHNTVSLSGSYFGYASATRSAAMHIQSGVTGINLRNNIFVNTFVNTNGAVGVASYSFASDAPPTAFTTLDYNNYFVGGSQGVLGWAAGGNQSDLATLATAIGANTNSKTDSIYFVSSGDLHLTGSSIGNLNLKCLPIVGLDTDIDNEIRDPFFAYMGADENTANPLPVTFGTFTANAKGDDVLLNWNTLTETNNRGFQVESSLDGRSFESVGFVKGAGNSNRNIYYTFMDVSALSKTNTVYYRLKQVDFNGTFAYSNIVKVRSSNIAENTALIAPNPFTSEISAFVNAKQSGMATISIVDLQGRTVINVQKQVIEGQNILQINNLDALQTGVYFIRISTVDGVVVTKVVKQ